jgi:uncharacterized Fe-S center protein
VDHKLVKLLNNCDLDVDHDQGRRITLKINTAEGGYGYGLRPGFYKIVAEEAVKLTETKPTICDSQKLVDYWNNTRGGAFLKGTTARGYNSESLGGNFVVNGGYSGDEGDLFSCGLDSELGGIEVGTAICRSHRLWVLSHITLHPLFGISGALLNGGFDCLSNRAKTRILNGTNPYMLNGQMPSGDKIESFRRRAIESNVAVNKSLDNQIWYINFLWDVTPQPDYYPFSDRPIMKNMGFLASKDPVALDSTTYSIIKENAENFNPADINFEEILKDAENHGLGKSEQTLVRLS